MTSEELLEEIGTLTDARQREASTAERKSLGQFFTVSSVALEMANLLRPRPGERVEVLDPGAGTGTLGIAAAANLLESGASAVHLTAIELDKKTTRLLKQGLVSASTYLGSSFSYEVVQADFLDVGVPFLGVSQLARPDVVIANPPYRKLPASDHRGGKAPNLYARFMEISQTLLGEGGELCFIIPRSYTSGHYFRSFRRGFHGEMAINSVRVFDSRRQAFRADGVLQENIILHCLKGRPSAGAVSIGGVGDAPGTHGEVITVPEPRVVDPTDANAWVYLPMKQKDLEILANLEALPSRLQSMGMEISTGPVVPFRSNEYLVHEPTADDFPLLWLQHVHRSGVRWPIGKAFSKAEHLSSAAPKKLLVPNQNMVLLRRFSAKEDRHRLVTAPLLKEELPGSHIAVENHLNLIYGTDRELSSDDVVGLAAVLNSDLYERYFRILNGNTQVSATEIRAIALPASKSIQEIGERINRGEHPTNGQMEELLRVSSR